MAHSTDKELHTSVTFVGTTVGSALLMQIGIKNPWATFMSGGLMMLAGHIKEHNDKFYDRADMTANSQGVILGTSLVIWF